VTEFRVPSQVASNRSHDRRTRLILWGAVSLILGISLFARYGARSVSPRIDIALAVATATIIMGAIGSTYFLAWRTGVQRIKLETTLLLTDRELIRQRSGWPEVRIGLHEIKALSEQPRQLVVEAVEPRRKITIPDDVEGFDNLRSELVKHGQVVKSARHVPLLAIVLSANLFCWAVVLLSEDRRVVEAMSVVVMVWLAWSSVRISKLLPDTAKRYILWAALACGWVAAVWVVYARLRRF